MKHKVLSIELGTVQTGTGKVDPARKLKCTTAARDFPIFGEAICLLKKMEYIFSKL